MLSNLRDPLKSFTKDVVERYHQRDSQGDYSIPLDGIPENIQDKLCALIINKTRELGNEACGADNDNFNTEMLRALISHLNNSLHEEKKEEFLSTWRAGIRSYLQNNMEFLLWEALQELVLCKQEAA
jgi:hypothetical protein